MQTILTTTLNRLNHLVLRAFWKLGCAFMKYFSTLRPLIWLQFYKKLGTEVLPLEFTHINLGFAQLSDKNEAFKKIQLEHYSDALYQEILSESSLENKELLEVGCGRGGGALFLLESYPLKTYVGVDQSPTQIGFCKTLVKNPKAEFFVDRAESLGFNHSSFDVVLNVESSHCYTSRSRFFKEVYRVLRSDGRFCIADVFNSLHDTGTSKEIERDIQNHGFEMLCKKEITQNVFHSRKLLSQSDDWIEMMKRIKVAGGNPSYLESIFCLPGTKGYEELRTGRMSYWRWVFRKG